MSLFSSLCGYIVHRTAELRGVFNYTQSVMVGDNNYLFLSLLVSTLMQSPGARTVCVTLAEESTPTAPSPRPPSSPSLAKTPSSLPSNFHGNLENSHLRSASLKASIWWARIKIGWKVLIYMSAFQSLKQQCQDYATALLDHTRSSSELEVILNYDPNGPAYHVSVGRTSQPQIYHTLWKPNIHLVI